MNLGTCHCLSLGELERGGGGGGGVRRDHIVFRKLTAN